MVYDYHKLVLKTEKSYWYYGNIKLNDNITITPITLLKFILIEKTHPKTSKIRITYQNSPNNIPQSSFPSVHIILTYIFSKQNV